MYTVVICPNCKSLWAVENRPTRTNCRKCEKTYQFKKLKHLAKEDTLEDAQLRFAEINAQLYDEYEELLDLRDEGYIFSGDIPKEDKKLSNEEIVKQGIEKVENATRENIISYAVDMGVTEKHADKIIDKLRHEGKLLKNNNSFSLI